MLNRFSLQLESINSILSLIPIFFAVLFLYNRFFVKCTNQDLHHHFSHYEDKLTDDTEIFFLTFGPVA
jgi:hypothetical protein